MQEFMLLIRNIGDSKSTMHTEEHTAFVKACEIYIGQIKNQGKLIAAQPLIREGAIIRRNDDAWEEIPFTFSGEIQVGYYHIQADDLQDAIRIAKENPEFAYSKNASIEVRPLKMKENTTGFNYPGKDANSGN